MQLSVSSPWASGLSQHGSLSDLSLSLWRTSMPDQASLSQGCLGRMETRLSTGRMKFRVKVSTEDWPEQGERSEARQPSLVHGEDRCSVPLSVPTQGQTASILPGLITLVPFGQTGKPASAGLGCWLRLQGWRGNFGTWGCHVILCTDVPPLSSFHY